MRGSNSSRHSWKGDLLIPKDTPCWRCGRVSKRGKGKRLSDGRYQCKQCTDSISEEDRKEFVTEIMSLKDFEEDTPSKEVKS